MIPTNTSKTSVSQVGGAALPNRSPQPLSDQEIRAQQLAEERILEGSSERKVSMEDRDVVEITKAPLSIEQVMDLPEERIRHLCAEQLTEVDKFLTDHPDQLFEMVKNYRGELPEYWTQRLYALGNNEYIARDQAHCWIIQSVVASIRSHNLQQGWGEVREQNRRFFEVVEKMKQKWEVDKARWDADMVRRREQHQQRMEELKNSPATQELEKRKAEAAERKRREDEAAALIDDLEGPVPNPAPQNGHSNYFKIAILVGLLAITYWCFRGKGAPPPPPEPNGNAPHKF